MYTENLFLAVVCITKESILRNWEENNDMKTIQRPIKSSIQRSKEFERKGLATHAINVGLLCGHKCTYCSTPAMIRMHDLFGEIGHTAFSQEVQTISHVDSGIPERLDAAVSHLKSTDTVMLSTISDAWAPEAKQHDLGRRCLKILLAKSKCQVRVLTKNAVVIEDFDLISRHRERVLVGLSLTGPARMSNALQVIEPYASPVEERVEAIRRARVEGLRIYGMLCPCLPGIADDPDSLREMMEIVHKGDPERIWVEPINPRGNGLIKTENALRISGFTGLADGIHEIRNKRLWSGYVRDLACTVHKVSREIGCTGKIRFLLYSKGMQERDRKSLEDLSNIVWLN